MSDIDAIITQLLQPILANGKEATLKFAQQKRVQIAESDIKSLCLKSREVFMSQPPLLELEAPIKIELDGPEDLRNFNLLPMALNDDWENVEDEDFDFSRVEAWDPDF